MSLAPPAGPGQDLLPGADAQRRAALHLGVLGPIAVGELCAAFGPPQPEAPAAGPPAQPLPAGYSGAPFMVGLIAELLRRGLRVTAFTLSSDLAPGQRVGLHWPALGLALQVLPMRPQAWRPNGWRPGRIIDLYATERRGLRHAVRAAGVQLLHAHWAYEFAWAAQASGLPTLVTCHDSPFLVARMYRGFRYAGYRWLRALMAWHVLRRAPQVSTVSPYMQGQIATLCRQVPLLVPNPLPGAVFDLQRPPGPRPWRVLMVCNGWGARKNPEQGLRAFSALAASRPDVELVLLGQDFGPDEAAERWWRAQGLTGTVHFVGRVAHRAVWDWMLRCDVLLHPALEESFGLVLAEALALGLSVVAGAASGAVPWVLGGLGHLVDVTDADALSRGLAQALQQARDPQRQQRARDAMRQRFHVQAVIDGYLQALAQVATEGGDARGRARGSATLGADALALLRGEGPA